MATDSTLSEAAIRFDERMLKRSDDVGASHFLGAMRLDARHLQRESQTAKLMPSEIKTDPTSFLFAAGDIVAAAVEGRVDSALSLIEALRPESDDEELLRLLLRGWLQTTTEALSAVDNHIRMSENLASPLAAWGYTKIATWALHSFGILTAQPYYDAAVGLATDDLQKALMQVGNDFGRDSYLFRPTHAQESVLFMDIRDRATEAVARLAVSKARKSLNPFSRTMGADPSPLPEQFRAAEMQAGWTGALWLLKAVWQLKAAILLQESHNPTEIADGIVAWTLSDGPDLFRLIDQNENIFTSEITNRVLIGNLHLGRRIHTSEWIRICSALWDELPTVVTDSLIESGPGTTALVTIDSSSRDEDRLKLFATLIRIDTEQWVDRYYTLSTQERQAVATAMDVSSVERLPNQIKSEMSDVLLNLFEDHEIHSKVSESTFLALASMLSNKGWSGITNIDRFRELIPAQYSSKVGIRYPEFKVRSLIEEESQRLQQQIHAQIEANRRGQWARYGNDLSLSLARTCVALQDAHEDVVRLLVDYANAPNTAADDVIGAVQALSWLADESLLPREYLGDTEILTYRADLSIVDRYWSGRDDLRSVNAAIAGYYARTLSSVGDATQRLIIAARDPDTQVRMLAMQEIASIPTNTLGGNPSIDAMVLGAIYDPESRVQAIAVKVLGLVSDMQVYQLAWQRIASTWDTSHRRVRINAAFAAQTAMRQNDSDLRIPEAILQLARIDRSLLVRESGEVGRHPLTTA